MKTFSTELKCESVGVASTDNFIYDGGLPMELDEGREYVISAWDTNVYIKGLGGREFEITKQYGPELTNGKEYLLISTKY